MLAAASIGAVWSSCSPDFGVNGVLDRFGQIEPKVLFAADGYQLRRQAHRLPAPASREIAARMPAWSGWSWCRIVRRAAGHGRSAARHRVGGLRVPPTQPAPPLRFEQLPFDHPLYIMYSSGTTGVPKCIVHGAGGTLLQHLKEHALHTDMAATTACSTSPPAAG